MVTQGTLAIVARGFVISFLALVLASCSTMFGNRVVRTGNVKFSTVHQMGNLDMDRKAPILVRIYKEERTLEVWKQNRQGYFAALKSYPICRYSGTLGPKMAEGDRQSPEGFYDLTKEQLNPFSREYLSFNIGYPNAFDRSLGRTGSYLMVHGGCASVGCYAMTDAQMDEIYGLVYEALRGGQQKIQIQAFPFRMTAQNLAHHRDNPNTPFWAMLKRGNDAFMATKAPPLVAVLGQQYVFNPGIFARGYIAPGSGIQ